ncbi:MAG: glycerol-3-phosphate 1-O-acyltransferase PlsY [Bryobacteraceae bacterium]
MIPVLLVIAAYLIGGIPFGYLLVKVFTGRDVRTMGSGNIGATNVLRSAGRGIGIATLLLDALKGWVAVWLMARFGPEETPPLWMSLAAVAVLLGHAYPVLLRFRGGKAVASFIGAFLYLQPWPLFSVLIVFVVCVAVTKYISMGSVMAAGTFPLAVWMISHPPTPILLAALISGALIIWRHRENIQRLRAGTERVFSLGGKKK